MGKRYRTVFHRLDALGLRLVGPEAPGGRQADPWPRDLPRDSRNVPTFHSVHQSPETAARQLDFVFASADLADRVALAWHPSARETRPLRHVTDPSGLSPHVVQGSLSVLACDTTPAL